MAPPHRARATERSHLLVGAAGLYRWRFPAVRTSRGASSAKRWGIAIERQWRARDSSHRGLVALTMLRAFEWGGLDNDFVVAVLAELAPTIHRPRRTLGLPVRLPSESPWQTTCAALMKPEMVSMRDRRSGRSLEQRLARTGFCMKLYVGIVELVVC